MSSSSLGTQKETSNALNSAEVNTSCASVVLEMLMEDNDGDSNGSTKDISMLDELFEYITSRRDYYYSSLANISK